MTIATMTTEATEAGQWVATPEWILAGAAVFTVSNPSGEHYTYRARRVEKEGKPPVWFLGLLTGPDNESDFTYLGTLNANTGEVRLTGASKLTADAKAVKVARWALGKVWSGRAFPEGYGLDHEGRCGRCGRTLTVPASTHQGFGPECWKIVSGG